jgi:hypothetical protein
MQNEEAQKAKLFEAVRRVDRAERELQEARAEYDVVYRDLVGRTVVVQTKPLPAAIVTKVGSHNSLKKRILEYLAEHPGEHGHKHIATALNASVATTRFTLWELQKEHRIEKSGIDRYRQLLPQNGATVRHDSV